MQRHYFKYVRIMLRVAGACAPHEICGDEPTLVLQVSVID